MTFPAFIEALAKIEDQKFLDTVDYIVETVRLQAERRSMRLNGVSHELRPNVTDDPQGKPTIVSWRLVCSWERAMETGRRGRAVLPASPHIRDEVVTCFRCLAADP